MTRTPHATSADIAKWKRLAKEAARASGDASVPLGDLEKATAAARRAIVPAGVIDKNNPFVRLVRTSQRYLASDRDRVELASDLAVLSQTCEAQLVPPPAPSALTREPRSRLPYADE